MENELGMSGLGRRRLGRLRKRLQKQVRPFQLHLGRDAATHPVVHTLSPALLFVAEELGDLRGATKGFDAGSVVHADILNDKFSLCKQSVCDVPHSPFMGNPVWNRLDRELASRRERHLVPGSWADIARALDTTEQRVNNWKRRGVPAAQHAALATIMGWSVDQLLGIAEAPAAPAESELHRRLLTAFNGCLPVDRAKFVSMIEARANELRELAKQMQAENLIPTPPSGSPGPRELRNPNQQPTTGAGSRRKHS